MKYVETQNPIRNSCWRGFGARFMHEVAPIKGLCIHVSFILKIPINCSCIKQIYFAYASIVQNTREMCDNKSNKVLQAEK